MIWILHFELGFWNAWIPMLLVLLQPVVMRLVDRVAGTGDLLMKMGDLPREKGQGRPFSIPTLLQVLLFIFSLFLPLQLGIVWFYIGFAIYALGTVMLLNAIVIAAKTPHGEVFSRGMYRYSRHPMYLSFVFLFLGISVAAGSWLFLFLAMGWMIFPLSQVNAEEQACLEAFGEAYRLYRQQTPKWLGLPRSG
jgi:protein-S-isoprenylcysteine O-methyltransferase Ste14